MGDQSEKKQFEKATFWALLGILATVIVGVPAIYFSIHEKRPHISYEIVGDSKVLDVHQPVKELEIRYRGEDIYALKKNLSVLTITIRNDGETHIKQSDFDESMPWGLQIKKAQLVDVPKLVSCNSDYIRDNINFQTTTNNLITFQKIIFERDKYFTIELQLLHHSEDEPEIDVVGKIAGIETQSVVSNIKDNGTIGFWTKVFYGSFTVQLVRLGIFLVGIILLLISIIFTSIMLQDVSKKRWRKKTDRMIESYLGYLLSGREKNAQESLKRLFIASAGDISDLEEAQSFLLDSEKIKFFLRCKEHPQHQHKRLPRLLSLDTYVSFSRRGEPDDSLGLFTCKSADKDEFAIRKDTTEMLNLLIAHLKNNELPIKLKKRLLSAKWFDYVNADSITFYHN